MATKWKKLINSTGMVITSLLIFLFLCGMVVSDVVKREFNVITVALLLFFLLVFLSSGITRWYSQTVERYRPEGYEVLKDTLSRYWKLQKIIPCVGAVLIFVISLVPFDGMFILEELYFYSMLWIFFVVVIIVPFWSIFIAGINYYWRINPTQEELSLLGDMCKHMEEGDPDIENPFAADSEFYRVGKTLTDINLVTKTAVERQVKSEKMKVDLITNISHDLKTPLTSISTYLDLMKKEELSDELKDYVEVLAERATKLKEMIESLFELSKTTSGNADLHPEPMEMNRLVEQILADMSGTIEQDGRIMKVDLTGQDTGFTADSSAMYRVCQNLFENALKYSLEGTRIFIRSSRQNGRIVLVVLNTANYEMNFTDLDIVERFTRGDEARTTDGNGLGLAIAKTYAEACGGEFAVSVEGDQFRAELSFPGTENSEKKEGSQ